MKKKKIQKTSNSFEIDGVTTPGFIMIPYSVFADKDLSPMDKFVYGAIHLFHSMPQRRCFASNQKLAEILNTTSSTIANCLSRLEEAGFIERAYSDVSKRRRTEIIPLELVNNRLVKNTKKSTKVKRSVSSNSETETESDSVEFHQIVKQSVSSNSETHVKSVSSNDETVSSNSETLNTPGDDTLNPLVKPYISEKNPISVSSFDEEKRVYIEKGKEFLSNTPSGVSEKMVKKEVSLTKKIQGNLRYQTPEEVPFDQVQAGIDLFAPVFPQQFTTGKPFAVPSNHKAVRELLMRIDLIRMATVIQKYLEKSSDPFLPQVNTIATFCGIKWDQIERFVNQESKKQLWGQKSISTAEESAVRDDQYAKSIAANREKQRLAELEWQKNNPNG